jgi:hypothetical protein
VLGFDTLPPHPTIATIPTVAIDRDRRIMLRARWRAATSASVAKKAVRKRKGGRFMVAAARTSNERALIPAPFLIFPIFL